jgi:hypothetical protein
MSILSNGLLTTDNVLSYVNETYKRHWTKARLFYLISNKKINIYQKIGTQNIYKKSDIDDYIATLNRKSSSGKRGHSYSAT